MSPCTGDSQRLVKHQLQRQQIYLHRSCFLMPQVLSDPQKHRPCVNFLPQVVSHPAMNSSCFSMPQVLSDPEKRQVYDRYGEEGLKEGGGGPEGPGGQQFHFQVSQMFSNFRASLHPCIACCCSIRRGWGCDVIEDQDWMQCKQACRKLVALWNHPRANAISSILSYFEGFEVLGRLDPPQGNPFEMFNMFFGGGGGGMGGGMGGGQRMHFGGGGFPGGGGGFPGALRLCMIPCPL